MGEKYVRANIDISELAELRAALVTERARGDRLAEALLPVSKTTCAEVAQDNFAGFESVRDCAAKGVPPCLSCIARRALAADPEGGPTDG